MPLLLVLLNSLSVWIFASGKRRERRCQLAPCSPASRRRSIFTNVKRFCGFGYALSKRCAEIVTSPNGEPPFGGSKMPRSVRCSVFAGRRLERDRRADVQVVAPSRSPSRRTRRRAELPRRRGLPACHLTSITFADVGSRRR